MPAVLLARAEGGEGGVRTGQGRGGAGMGWDWWWPPPLDPYDGLCSLTWRLLLVELLLLRQSMFYMPATTWRDYGKIVSKAEMGWNRILDTSQALSTLTSLPVTYHCLSTYHLRDVCQSVACSAPRAQQASAKFQQLLHPCLGNHRPTEAEEA